MRLSQFKQTKNVELVIDINSLVEYQLEREPAYHRYDGTRTPSNKSIKLCKDKRSYIDNEGFWNVYPIAFNHAQVYVVCPHCGEIHLHGRGKKPDYKYEGHRACQCLNCNNNGYIIVSAIKTADTNAISDIKTPLISILRGNDA